MFYSHSKYRHSAAKDLDIQVIKVSYQDSKRSKLLIRWISQTTGNVVMIPGLEPDGIDKIEIQEKDYKYWKKL